MLDPTGCALTIEAHHATPGTHRLNRSNTQLHRLLHRHVHFIPGLQGLDECDPQRRLTLSLLPGEDIDPHSIFFYYCDAGGVLAPATIEQE